MFPKRGDEAVTDDSAHERSSATPRYYFAGSILFGWVGGLYGGWRESQIFWPNKPWSLSIELELLRNPMTGLITLALLVVALLEWRIVRGLGPPSGDWPAFPLWIVMIVAWFGAIMLLPFPGWLVIAYGAGNGHWEAFGAYAPPLAIAVGCWNAVFLWHLYARNRPMVRER